MLKASAQEEARRTAASGDERSTKERIVEAAVETLKRKGFAGASARAIAKEGGFNQALIFYHFGTVHRLLLAALDRTSVARMERYRDGATSARTFDALIDTAADVYSEDLRSGHIKVLSELIAGASSSPDLGPAIVRRVEPWIDFAETQLTRALAGSNVETLVPARDAAYAVVSLYLGIELLSHLEGSSERADRLFDVARTVARLVGPVLALGSAMREEIDDA